MKHLVGVVVLVACVMLLYSYVFPKRETASGQPTVLPPIANSPTASVTLTEQSTGQLSVSMVGLKIQVLREGEGAKAKTGQTVSIHYIARVENGPEVERRTKENPMRFTLGTSDVIQGFHAGVEGMKIGEKRRLTLSGPFLRGKTGGVVKPGVALTMVYEVELVKID